jgi:polysaccharide biosynthesis transport protein
MEERQVLSIRPYLDVILRHALTAVCVLAVGIGITICALVMLPDVFRSSTLVLIEPPEVSQSYIAAPTAAETLNRVKILSTEALSRNRLEQVIQELDLYPGQRAAGVPMDELVAYMRKRISIDLTNNDEDSHGSERLNSFRIGFEYPGAIVAQKVAARVAEVFINEDLRQRTGQATAANSFLQDQVASARLKLDAKSDAIKSYKTQHAGSLPQELESNLNQLKSAQERLNTMAPLVEKAVQDSPEVKLKNLKTQLITMRAQYGDQYPDVVALRAQVKALEESEAAAAKDPKARHDDAGPSALVARDDELRRTIDEYRQRIEETPKHEQELAELQRDYEVLTKDYQTLLQKKLEAQVSAQLLQREEGERFRVLDPANLPLKPERPNRMAIMLLGVILSFAAALGLPFGLSYTDTSFKDPDELAKEYGIPVLVAIPTADEKEKRAERIWTVFRAVAATSVTLSLGAAVIWIYATRIF